MSARIALFACVQGEWRFEGLLTWDVFKQAHPTIKSHIERENGPGTFFSVELPDPGKLATKAVRPRDYAYPPQDSDSFT